MKLNLLVIVPARKGNTGLKNKNTLLLNNLPLVEFSFKAASLIKKKKDIYFVLVTQKKY